LILFADEIFERFKLIQSTAKYFPRPI